MDKIYTLSQTIIVKKFGQVNIQVLKRIGPLLQELTTPFPLKVEEKI